MRQVRRTASPSRSRSGPPPMHAQARGSPTGATRRAPTGPATSAFVRSVAGRLESPEESQERARRLSDEIGRPVHTVLIGRELGAAPEPRASF